jgi:PAS domain S-box-containing protein
MSDPSDAHSPRIEPALRLALDTLARLHEAAVVVDDERILDATPDVSRILGYDLGELRAFPSAILLADPSHRSALRARRESAERGVPSPAHLEIRVVRKDGRRAVLDVVIARADEPSASQRIVALREVGEARVVSRDVVRRLLALVANGAAREPTLRLMGREVARQLATHNVDIPVALAAFAAEGLGDLSLAHQEDHRYLFTGVGLIECPPRGEGPQTSSFLALTFLETLVSSATRGEALGAEVACTGRDASACRFVIRSRARREAPAVAVPTEP